LHGNKTNMNWFQKAIGAWTLMAVIFVYGKELPPTTGLPASESSLTVGATISGSATVCLNATGVQITFTGTGGTAPYTFKYTLNGTPMSVQSTGSVATVDVTTSAPGDIVYALTFVKDSAPGAVDVAVTGTATVTVLPNFSVSAGTDLIVCKGSAINLSASLSAGAPSGTTFSWSGPNSFTGAGQSLVINNATGLMSGNYTVTATKGQCQKADVVQVTVLEPAVDSGNLQNYQGTQWLVKCTSPGATTGIVFINNGLTSGLQSLVTGYSVDWGDGSPLFSSSSAVWNNGNAVNHTYNIGLYSLTVTIQTTLSCTISRSYNVFVGNQPASPQIQLPVNAQGCVPFQLDFPISGVSGNIPGTTYIITFSDDPANPLNFDQNTIPSSIQRTFVTSSCGSTFVNGSTTENNAFGVSMQAINPCGSASSSAGPIRTSTPPTALISAPPKRCVNQIATIQDQSVNGSIVTSNSCNNLSGRYWEISPATGWSLNSGSIGNNGGFPDDYEGWNNGTENLSITFTVAGNYTIKLYRRNSCAGTSTDTEIICVENPLSSASFTINTSGCGSLTAQATNTTPTPSGNSCGVTYNWQVSYGSSACGTPPPANYNYFATGSSATSVSPTLVFPNPGTYTVTLTAQNVCGNQTASQTVTVKAPPSVSIAPISNICSGTSATIAPTATVVNCGTTPPTYNWTFPGGSPSSFTGATPPAISYSMPGNYTVSLVVSNECGNAATAQQTFTVNNSPAVTNTVLSQAVCSGLATTPVTLTASLPGTTFSWTATATTGITGFLPSGNGNIPAQTLSTSATSPGTVTYQITPSLGGCQGPAVTYTIGVNPAPAFQTQPVGQTLCDGGTPNTLSVALNNASGATYQWFVSNTSGGTGTPVATNGTGTSYDPPATPGTKYYYCQITLPATVGCSTLQSNVVPITVVPVVSISTPPIANQQLCVGGTATPLSVTATGGTGALSYQWYEATSPGDTVGSPVSGATSSTFIPGALATPGIRYYFVRVSASGAGCGTAQSATVIVEVVTDPQITTQPIATQTLCAGATPQALTVTATGAGSTGALSYQWFQDINNDGVGGTPVGTGAASYTPALTGTGTFWFYCVVSQPSSGCATTSTVSQLTVSPSPTFTNQPQSAAICQGGTAPVLSVTIANGVGTPTYQWYQDTDTTVGGGTPVGTNQSTYSPASSTQGVFYYYCEVTFPGGGGCATVSSAMATITVTGAASITGQPLATQSVCVGTTVAAPLAATFSGGTGTPSWQWYSNTTASNTGGQIIGGATSSSYLPPAYTTPGTYHYYAVLTLSGSGCGTVTTDPATVTVVADPVIDTQPLSSQSLCQNATPAPLSVNAINGIGTFSYQWFANSTNSTTGGAPVATGATFSPPTTPQGTTYYYCVVTQSGPGCSVVSNTAAVIVTPSPSLSTQPQSQTLCLGTSASTLTVAVSNPIGTPQYQWYEAPGNAASGGTPVGTNSATYTPVVTSAGTKYYYVEVTLSSGGCGSLVSAVATITVNPFATIGNTTKTICSGNSFTVSPTTNGTDNVPSGTTYSWPTPVVSPANALTGAVASSNQTTISQALQNTTTNPATALYTVTPTTGSCAGTPFTITVTVNPSVMSNVTQVNSPCFGANAGALSPSITGGIPFSTGAPYQVSWTGPSGFTATTPSINALAPGIYTLDITDQGGCPLSETYTILEPNLLAIAVDAEHDATCFGSDDGSVSLSITGGTPPYSYTWTKDTAAFATTEDISNLAPGTYEVTVSDVNSCGPATAVFTITEPPVLDVTLVSKTDIICNGAATGAISISATGGTPFTGANPYQFAWSGPNGFTSSQQDLSAVYAGNYTVVVTDASGCTDTLTVTLTEPPGIQVAVTTTPMSCYNANDASVSLAISGGTGPYTVNWSNLATGTFQANLAADTYTITITDASNCPKVITVVVDQAPLFDVTPVVREISCFGANDGSINLNFVGGIAPVTLVWSDGSTAGTQRNNLGPGTYSVTITDSKPCVISRTFVLVEPQPLVVSANVTNAFDCNDANSGAINLMVAGGSAPFTYQWTNGATTEDLLAIPAGNYGVTVTDARGCTRTATYVVNRPPPLVAVVDTQSDFDCGTRYVKQTFHANVTGGFPPYQLQWSSGTVSGANNEIMETEQEGAIVLDVVDAQGCTTQYSFNVDIPVLGEAGFTRDSFAYQTFGYYSIQDPIQFTNGATGDWESISWDFGDGSFSADESPVHTYVREGEYVVKQTVTYPFGCIYTAFITFLVDKGYELMIPNAFTPNGDGLNDTFVPVYRGLDSIELEIFTTWGEKIYQEKGTTIAGWNGEVKDLETENGNYYYKITAKTFYGGIITEKGPLVLLK